MYLTSSFDFLNFEVITFELKEAHLYFCAFIFYQDCLKIEKKLFEVKLVLFL